MRLQISPKTTKSRFQDVKTNIVCKQREPHTSDLGSAKETATTREKKMIENGNICIASSYIILKNTGSKNHDLFILHYLHQ